MVVVAARRRRYLRRDSRQKKETDASARVLDLRAADSAGEVAVALRVSGGCGIRCGEGLRGLRGNYEGFEYTDAEFADFDQLLRLRCASGETVADRYVCTVQLVAITLGEIAGLLPGIEAMSAVALAQRAQVPSGDVQRRTNEILERIAESVRVLGKEMREALAMLGSLEARLREDAVWWQKHSLAVWEESRYGGVEAEAELIRVTSYIQTERAPRAAAAVILARRYLAEVSGVARLATKQAIQTAEGRARVTAMLDQTLEAWGRESPRRKSFAEKITDGLESTMQGLLRVGGWIALGVIAWYVVPPLAKKLGEKVGK